MTTQSFPEFDKLNYAVSGSSNGVIELATIQRCQPAPSPEPMEEDPFFALSRRLPASSGSPPMLLDISDPPPKPTLILLEKRMRRERDNNIFDNNYDIGDVFPHLSKEPSPQPHELATEPPPPPKPKLIILEKRMRRERDNIFGNNYNIDDVFPHLSKEPSPQPHELATQPHSPQKQPPVSSENSSSPRRIVPMSAGAPLPSDRRDRVEKARLRMPKLLLLAEYVKTQRIRQAILVAHRLLPKVAVKAPPPVPTAAGIKRRVIHSKFRKLTYEAVKNRPINDIVYGMYMGGLIRWINNRMEIQFAPEMTSFLIRAIPEHEVQNEGGVDTINYDMGDTVDGDTVEIDNGDGDITQRDVDNEEEPVPLTEKGPEAPSPMSED